MGESMKGLKRTHRCTEVNASLAEEKVVLMGWIKSRRNLGGLKFAFLRDVTGLVQIIFDSEFLSEDKFNQADSLRSEYVVAVEGIVKKRDEASVNKDMETGDIEIIATDFRVLAESETPPFQIEDNVNVNEELRLKYRYLDLRRESSKERFLVRHKIAQTVRNFYTNENFLEIETPVLTKSTPEGARDYLVPSRVHGGEFYALPQSPQLFKQLFMVSGFDRYFQITKCFRDEDLRADRQPEFTQIDTEMSFVEEEDVMNINERMLTKLFKEIKGIDIELPIQRMTFAEAMNRYGSDKPDLRFGMELNDISELVKDSEFVVFSSAIENGGSVRGITVKGQVGLGRKQIDKLVDFAKTYKAKGLAWIGQNEDGTFKSSVSKFFSEEQMLEILSAMKAEKGDLVLLCADKDQVVFDTLGALRNKLARDLELIDDSVYKFLWVTEFPLLEYNEEAGRYTAMHHPFTMPMEEDMHLLDTDPGKVRSKAYDIVLNGYEIGGGSIRIHQKDIQSKMFKYLGFSEEEAGEQFGFLLDAFKYGVPPHGGLAYGLDRLTMILTGTENIRDVIAFPKTKDARCLMTDAPGEVVETQLDELSLKVYKQDK